MLFSCTHNALFIWTHTPKNMLGTSLVLFFPKEGSLSVITGLCLHPFFHMARRSACPRPGLQGVFIFSILSLFLNLILSLWIFVQKLTWDMNSSLLSSYGGLTHLKIFITMTEYRMPRWIRKFRCQFIIQRSLKRINLMTAATRISFVKRIDC